MKKLNLEWIHYSTVSVQLLLVGIKHVLHTCTTSHIKNITPFPG